ncbi:MAG TPA: M10 family metallopeptidase C-terminal domain-containing protein, partial [Allosphingosinicella sp.]|nr:M10 family metallopeptidase C-terminal domain-containing protein [Allosphingosinicella sp.]
NQAANHLTGGAGADTFTWKAVADSQPAKADTITDFLKGSDRIDLSAIDAKPATASDDAFKFIGTAAFSGVAGELRQEAGTGGLHVLGDVNGDKVPDFDIFVANQASLTTVDFQF